MFKVILFLFFICCWGSSLAQSAIEFGKFDQAEALAYSCPKDTSAVALFVYEKGDSEIKLKDNTVLRLFHKYFARIKVFKHEGLDYATFKIPLYRDESRSYLEKMEDLKVVSYDPETGKITYLLAYQIFNSEINEYYDQVSFTVPNVQIGTVFDVYYETVSPFFFNFTNWKFQDEVPKLYSEFRATYPANFKYNVKLVGGLELFDQQFELKRNCLIVSYGGSADCSVLKYIMRDVPSFKEEEYMTAKENHLSQIEYELVEYKRFDGSSERYSRDWKDVDKEYKYDRDIGRGSRKTKWVQEHLPDSLLAGGATLATAKRIYSYLQSKLSWNGNYHLFREVDVKETLEGRTGNVAELNLTLLNALAAAGLDVHFMLLSTRSNGLPTKLYPILSEFNYLIVKLDLDGTSYLLDITEKNAPFGMLPLRCLNSYGRVMDFEKGSYWHEIKPELTSELNIALQLEMLEEGYLKGVMRYKHSGYFAMVAREYIKALNNDTYQENWFNSTFDWSILNYRCTDLDILDKPVVETLEIISEDTITEDVIFIYPFLKSPYISNPFKLEERAYPVDFAFPFNLKYQILLKLPNNVAVKQLPKNRIITFEDRSISLDFQSSENQRIINVILRFNVAGVVYHKEQYQSLKEIFSELIEILRNTPITLERTN